MRGPFLGAWMNFVIMLLVQDRFQSMTVAMFETGGAAASPFWLVLEGALIGLAIEFVATHVGGEGPETVRTLLVAGHYCSGSGDVRLWEYLLTVWVI